MGAIILDIGGDTIKAGCANSDKPSIVANYGVRPKRERKLYIGDQVDQLQDWSSVYYQRPVSKGYIVNFDAETEILQRVVTKLQVDPKETALIVTQPPFVPQHLRENMGEMVFENLGFMSVCLRLPAVGASLHRSSLLCAGSSLKTDPSVSTYSSSSSVPPLSSSTAAGTLPSSFQPVLPADGTFAPSLTSPTPSSASRPSPCLLVVDSGFSFTHAVPLFDNSPLNFAIRRLDVGGKLLSNYLKETVSYRHYDMMDELHTISHVKEKLCFVAQDFLAELAHAKQSPSHLRREYILPNGSSRLEGYVKGDQLEAGKNKPSKKRKKMDEDETVLPVGNERITIPEVLFNPSDIGLSQVGLASTVMEAVQACPISMQPLFLSNVVLTGGNARLPGFASRLEKELRAAAPVDFPVSVFSPEDPLISSWCGLQLLARSSALPKLLISRQDYDECGSSLAARHWWEA